MIFILIIIFSLLGMKALFYPGLFTAHDIWHQVVRLYYYNQSISDGQFPPYWIGQLANGFGYPLFLFSYQLPWIIGTALLKMGLDIPTAIKTLFFLSYIGSGVTMYIFVRHLLQNRIAALLSSLIYLWLPYHFLIIFVGASMGVSFIFTFLPLVFLGILLLKENGYSGVLLLSIGLAGIILSHLMHLVFLFPVIAIFSIWVFKLGKKIVFIKNLCFGLILTFLLSSFYLLPAFFYNNATRVHGESGLQELYKRNFINFDQLIYSKWNFSPIVNNAKNGEVSFQLGIVQWIAVLMLIILIIVRGIKPSYRSLSIYLLLSFVTSIFLMLDFSKQIWEIFIKFAAVDFPFRFLLPATFIASLAAGLVFVNINKQFRFVFFSILILIALYTNRNHINVNQYTDLPVSTYLSLETERTTNTFNEYLPEKADDKLLGSPWNEIKGNNLSVSNINSATNMLSFDVSVAEDQIVSVGQFYFPGQTLYLDRKITSANIDSEGRISFPIESGMHSVSVKYQPTLLMLVSGYLTLSGLLLVFFLIFRKRSYS